VPVGEQDQPVAAGGVGGEKDPVGRGIGVGSGNRFVRFPGVCGYKAGEKEILAVLMAGAKKRPSRLNPMQLIRPESPLKVLIKVPVFTSRRDTFLPFPLL